MKTTILFFMALMINASVLFAQSDDATVSSWIFRPWMKYNIPTEGISAYARKAVLADTIADFDPINADFDATWNAATSTPNVIANNLGLADSHKGTADFEGAFKMLYDNENIYMLLRVVDDNVSGTESFEVMWAPYFRINSSVEGVDKNALRDASRFHMRFSQFGGYKILINTSGYKEAMFFYFDPLATDPTLNTNVNWAGNTDVVSNTKIFVDDKSQVGSNTIKKIITIPFTALTGTARPDFNTSIWRQLNDGKGITFDIKYTDIDADDAFNTATPALQKPAEYWWNSTHNDGYAVTYFNGFVGLRTASGVNQPNAKTSIFSKISSNKVELTDNADVVVYNSIGNEILKLNNVKSFDLNNLKSGVYILRAKNQTVKVVL